MRKLSSGLFIVLLFSIVACGGGGATSTTPTPEPTAASAPVIETPALPTPTATFVLAFTPAPTLTPTPLPPPTPIPLSSSSPVFTVTITSPTAGVSRALNGVQGGPGPINEGDRDLTTSYQDAKIKLVRLPQDDGFAFTLATIFSDTKKAANDPAAYNFAALDKSMESVVKAGATPLWQAIYDIGGGDRWGNCCQAGRPPQDVNKWAAVITYTLSHLNDKWANGYEWNIRYIEFSNEPCGLGGFDCQTPAGRNQFYQAYAAFARAIRDYNAQFKREVKVVCCGNPINSRQLNTSLDALNDFLRFAQTNRVTPDIFSYHAYDAPTAQQQIAQALRQRLDQAGLRQILLWNSEWNMALDDAPPTVRAFEPAMQSAYAATHHAQSKTYMQPFLDEAIVYRANRAAPRPNAPTPSNSLFFQKDGKPLPAYWGWHIFQQIAEDTPQRLNFVAANAKATPTLLVARNNDRTRFSLLLSHWCLSQTSECPTQTYGVRFTGLRPNSALLVEKYVVDSKSENLNAVETALYPIRADGTLWLTGRIDLWTLHYWKILPP